MLKKNSRTVGKKVRKYPLISFFVLLFLLLVLIIAGNYLRKPQEERAGETSRVKESEVYDFDQAPYLGLSAKVDKKSVLTINATTNGIVNHINVREGQKVAPGKRLISIADTYGGANLSAIERRIAQVTKDIQDITYEKNEDILDFQRDEVPRTGDEANEFARKQVTVQKRNLDLTKETTDLNLERARIADALNYPSAPAHGLIEKIYVNPGQSVQTGQPLVSFVADKGHATAEILISMQIAKMVSVQKYSYIHINESKLAVRPIYISKESTEGQQYSIIYTVPEEYAEFLADESFVRIEIPLENGVSENQLPMIPIDSVQLTQDKSFVFVFNDGVAESREVFLGKVFGQFVEVVEGLNEQDEIILNRNVFHGDRVSKVGS